MSRNLLEPDAHRVGFIFDNDERTPYQAALLENTGTNLVLTIPWHDDINAEYSRWFMGRDMRWGDDPDRSKFAYMVPECIDFHDNDGSVVLVGCRSAGYRSQFGGHSRGRITARYAVLGGDGASAYQKINALQSEIDGLARWFATSTLERSDELTEHGWTSSTYTAQHRARLPIAHGLNLTLVTSFEPDESGRDTVLKEPTRVETRVADARSWSQHMAPHLAIRDLLAVAAWKTPRFLSHRAMTDSDPARSLSGARIGEAWHPVVTYATNPSPAEEGADLDLDHLFLFNASHVHVAGVRRWMKLRNDFSRGIDPILSSLQNPGAPVPSRVTEMGIGLEAIGYELLLQDGESPRAARGANFRERLERIARDISSDLGFEPMAWAQRMSDVYNGTKHANREKPEFLESLNGWRQSVQVFRAWIASQLGVDTEKLTERLALDRLSHPYELR
ncbi:HEPN domain-containing protein [Aeromicrobium sp. Sec7.5]|uniref:ApeA N-terminal domain 1-containing protein n=1 Tax=Aeromicrobium sp. Sec7.5 TaxID=3121276 RepID=UPI002FE4840D